MPDITMCNGENCPIKNACLRFLATPDSYQSFFCECPFDHENDECEYLIEVERSFK